MSEDDILELNDNESLTIPARILKHYINRCNEYKEDVDKLKSNNSVPVLVVSELLSNTSGNLHTLANGYITAYDFMSTNIVGDVTVEAGELRNVINNIKYNTKIINIKNIEINFLKNEITELKSKLKVARELNILKQPLHIKGVQTYINNMQTTI